MVVVVTAGPGIDLGFDGRGRSDAHASQHRKFGGFSSVHVGHVHGFSYALLSDIRSTGSGGGGTGDEEVGLVLSGTGGGDMIDRGPAGLPSLGGIYEGPYRSRSSCCINSIYACVIARSLASSSSALVLKPFLDASSARSLVLSRPEAQPLVTSIRRCVASAMTRRKSVPRNTGAPPSLRPDPAERTLLCSAAARACLRASSMGILRPPSRRPWERNPSPVYPFRTSSSCSSRSWFQSAWNSRLCGPWTIWQSLSSISN